MAAVMSIRMMTKPILTTNRLKNTFRKRVNSLTRGAISVISALEIASPDMVYVSLFVTNPGVKPTVSNVYNEVDQNDE